MNPGRPLAFPAEDLPAPARKSVVFATPTEVPATPIAEFTPKRKIRALPATAVLYTPSNDTGPYHGVSIGSEKSRKRIKHAAKAAALPVFRPFFTMVITLAQIIVAVVMASQGHLSKISFTPSMETVAADIGVRPENTTAVTRIIPANVFIGPPAAYLLQHGAKFAPCMRKDTAIFVEYARQRELEQSTFGLSGEG
jgi:hypothetical protein